MNTGSHVINDPFRAMNARFDRRRQVRVPICIPIKLFPPGVTGRGFHSGTCTNISESGLSFESKAVLHLSNRIDVEFRPPGHPAFRRKVALLYRMGDRYGGYFVGD